MYIWIILFISNHNENEYRLRLSKCYKRTCSGYTLLMCCFVNYAKFVPHYRKSMHAQRSCVLMYACELEMS